MTMPPPAQVETTGQRPSLPRTADNPSRSGPPGPIPGSTVPAGQVPRRRPGPSAPEPDSAANWDRLLRARVGRLSFGLSPPGLLLVLPRLAGAPGLLPGQAAGPGQEAAAQGPAVRPLRRPRCVPAGHTARHRAAAARPAVRRPRLAAVALQPVLSVVPVRAAMAAQRHHRGARRIPPRRGGRHLCRAAAPRRLRPDELPVDQPRGPEGHLGAGRDQLRPRRAELPRRLGAGRARPEAGRHGGVPGRPGRWRSPRARSSTATG